MREKVPKNVDVLISEPKTENIRVTACCNDAGQFLASVLIFKTVDKKQEVADDLQPGSDVYMTWKSSYINTHLFSMSFREQFLKQNTSGKVILVSDGRRAQCSFPFLLQTTVENKLLPCVYQVTVLATSTSRISVFLGP